MTDTGQGSAPDAPFEHRNTEGVVEKTCKLLSALALMVLLVVVGRRHRHALGLQLFL